MKVVIAGSVAGGAVAVHICRPEAAACGMDKEPLQSLSPAFRLEGGAASLSKNLAGGEVFLV